MRISVNLLLLYLSLAISKDLDSYEFERVELTPIHDAIIFNDIADIMNEFESNMNPQLDYHVFSNSESDEEIENLLTEYQQYLDKAHKQTINYLKKSKGKNKVPLVRHEKFTKLKPIAKSNLDESNIYFDMKHSPDTFLKKFILQTSNVSPVKISEDLPKFLKNSHNEKRLIDLPPILPKTSPDLIQSSSYCKVNAIPSKCGCKQCLILDSVIPITFNEMRSNSFTENVLKTRKRFSEDDLNNNINIRIKIDVQLPNVSMLEDAIKYRNQGEIEDYMDKMSYGMIKTINLPFPYSNFPIPIETIGYKQNLLKEDSSPVHQITIHKKKKYHSTNNNKKHKNKKFISVHHYKFDPQLQQNVTEQHFNNNENGYNNSGNVFQDEKLLFKNISKNNTTQLSTTLEPQITTTNNKSFEKISLTLNLSKENMNNTEGIIKSENSIETDIIIDKDNITSLRSLRLKRELKRDLLKIETNINETLNSVNKKNLLLLLQDKHLNNTAADFVADIDLLYWPSARQNQSLIPSKNITALILDREIRKAKLNMTEYSMRNNRTMALEKAIFGNIDWNDVDAVVPAFMSFVGKYIRGVLTFCSENNCHSMKCAEKICIHRICTLENRYNGIGHCAGNNVTDSLATMESIMDLPSNIAFEIVDILQAKMLGKLFGKVTLCINTKCSAFSVYMKKFQKTKCSLKNLNSSGHCPNIKNVKNI